jgi:hypothetical protein
MASIRNPIKTLPYFRLLDLAAPEETAWTLSAGASFAADGLVLTADDTNAVVTAEYAVDIEHVVAIVARCQMVNTNVTTDQELIVDARWQGGNVAYGASLLFDGAQWEAAVRRDIGTVSYSGSPRPYADDRGDMRVLLFSAFATANTYVDWYESIHEFDTAANKQDVPRSFGGSSAPATTSNLWHLRIELDRGLAGGDVTVTIPTIHIHALDDMSPY